MQLLGLCGSLRRASMNRALLRAVGETLPAGAALTIYDSLDLPLFNSDLAPEPAAVGALKEAIRAADGLVIATPEYNYSVTAALKNAIDWSTRPLATSPLRGKPIGIVGAATGMSGTMRAQYHLRQMLVFTDSPALAQPEVLIPRAHERFVDGALTDDSTHDLLRAFGAALVAHVGRYPRA
jgi:chromate reductase